MKIAYWPALALVAVGLFPQPADTQQITKKVTHLRPSPGPSVVLLGQWNEIGRKLIAMAEDFPDDKYDFCPASGTSSFAERLIHAASANYYFTNKALGTKLPTGSDPPRAEFANKAAVVAYIKKSFADGASVIQAKGDTGISETAVDPFGFDNPQGTGNPIALAIWPAISSSIAVKSTAN